MAAFLELVVQVAVVAQVRAVHQLVVPAHLDKEMQAVPEDQVPAIGVAAVAVVPELSVLILQVLV
jgi:hypothetical protein